MTKFECSVCNYWFYEKADDASDDCCPKCGKETLFAYPKNGECILRSESDPIHQHKDGTWWFYDETWTCESGPYNTEEYCNNALRFYRDF